MNKATFKNINILTIKALNNAELTKLQLKELKENSNISNIDIIVGIDCYEADIQLIDNTNITLYIIN